MIRIVYFTSDLTSGGAQSNLVDIVTNLDRSVYSPIILTLHNGETRDYHFGEALESADIPIYSLDMSFPPNGFRYYVIAVQRYIRVMRELQPDVVQSLLFVVNSIARVARPFMGQHHLITIEQQGWYSQKRLRYTRFTAWLSDILVANSQQTYDILRNAHIPEKLLTILVYGFDLKSFQHCQNTALREEQFGDDSFVFLNIARIHENKDQLTLVKASERLRFLTQRPFVVAIVGEIGSENIYRELMTYIDDHNMHDYVQFLPPTNDVVSYYHACDIFVLPSRTESFGRVTIEAMATGTPVIISEGGNAARAVTENNGWIFQTGNADELAGYMLEAMHLSQYKLHELGQLAKSSIQTFALGTMISNYEALYQQILKT